MDLKRPKNLDFYSSNEFSILHMENFVLNDIEDDIVSLFSIVNDFSNCYDDVYGQLHEKPNKNHTREPYLVECEIIRGYLKYILPDR